MSEDKKPITVAEASEMKAALLAAVSTGTCVGGVEDAANDLIAAFIAIDAATSPSPSAG